MSKFESWNQTPYIESVKDLQKLRWIFTILLYDPSTHVQSDRKWLRETPCYQNELGKYYEVEIKNVSFVSRFYLNHAQSHAGLSNNLTNPFLDYLLWSTLYCIIL